MTDIDRWLREFPQAWAETGGIGLAQHRPAIYIELKPGADPVKLRAELTALAKALTMGEGKRINIYTDSRCAFATAHVHGALHRERGLLTAEGKTVKNKTEILELLRALWLPKALGIIHCPGHQKADTPVARGNRLADLKAKEAALLVTQVLATTLPDLGAPTLPDTPNYTDADLHWIKRLPMTNSSIILPEELGRRVLSKMHRSTHMGTRKMEGLIRHAKITIKDSRAKIEQIVASCHACQLTNATAHGSNPGTRLWGTTQEPTGKWTSLR
ncbi:unnamed protein product [Nyctereutes procyonoides]|uniref:(raccoon dog) hypothetical protein n=1 Tax=Nyctereutes procyonoides TaxID=34880 RepID=A0A811ZG59_NYCPR|nr:unnamed protein product [Nyctereutes procyonoides]